MSKFRRFVTNFSSSLLFDWSNMPSRTVQGRNWRGCLVEKALFFEMNLLLSLFHSELRLLHILHLSIWCRRLCQRLSPLSNCRSSGIAGRQFSSRQGSCQFAILIRNHSITVLLEADGGADVINLAITCFFLIFHLKLQKCWLLNINKGCARYGFRCLALWGSLLVAVGWGGTILGAQDRFEQCRHSLTLLIRVRIRVLGNIPGTASGGQFTALFWNVQLLVILLHRQVIPFALNGGVVLMRGQDRLVFFAASTGNESEVTLALTLLKDGGAFTTLLL